MESSKRSRFVQFLNEVKRSRTDRRLGGVCGGMAAHSGVPVWVYRALFLTSIVLAVGILGYISLWIFMPLEGASPATEPAGAEA